MSFETKLGDFHMSGFVIRLKLLCMLAFIMCNGELNSELVIANRKTKACPEATNTKPSNINRNCVVTFTVPTVRLCMHIPTYAVPRLIMRNHLLEANSTLSGNVQ
jgi:hypothetical protein